MPEYLRLRANLQSLQVTWEKYEASGNDTDRLAMQNELVSLEEQLVEYDKILSSEAEYANCKTSLNDVLIFTFLKQAVFQADNTGMQLLADNDFPDILATKLFLRGSNFEDGIDLSLIGKLKNVTILAVSFWRSATFMTLPGCLRIFVCNNNAFVELPPLPSNLLALECNNNELQTLPELPTGLTELSCSGNRLNSLPTLPKTLERIHCVNNFITDVPDLPASLTHIDLRNNHLTESAKQKLQKFRQDTGATIKY